MSKQGCPDHFVSIVKSFGVGMVTRVNTSGGKGAPILGENVVKQDTIYSPNSFYLYFVDPSTHAFVKVINFGIYVRYQSSAAYLIYSDL